MAGVATTFLERVAGRAVTTAAFRMEGGSAKSSYIVANSGAGMFGGTAANDASVITEILGTATVGTKRLKRTLPLAHPLYPWLYASEISVQGVGNPSAVQAAGDTYEAAPITATTAAFPYYEITVTFTPREYAVTPDEQVDDYSLSWRNSDNGPETVQVQKEWARYTTWSIEPQPEIITAQQGLSYFATSTSALTPTPAIGHASNPHGFTFPGFPRLTIPRAKILLTWHQVPFSYLESSNSYLTEYIGCINQSAWFGWPAGSLLYEAVSARRYVPPAPALRVADDGIDYTPDKLCDITLILNYVKREQSSVPNFSAINQNWVAAGHNLHPWFGNRNFYHTVYPTPGATNTTSGWKPTYLSVPFEILFQNPDYV